MKNIWSSIKSLLVVFPYEDDEQLKLFRKSLDKMLNSSNVDRLIVVVNIPKDVDKNSLPPHFLIYYNSPNDFNFWGKLKDVQLEAELTRAYDVLLWFGDTDKKIYSQIQETSFQRKIIINQDNPSFDLSLNAGSDAPDMMLNFVIETLKKITTDE
ncbi:MAG: hypothetical protein FJZ66_04340 [Bacteroidetes bacterium]|nr:hypothetical protein [Bacteroidota bacterium]